MEYQPGVGRIEACQGCNACVGSDCTNQDLVISDVVGRVIAQLQPGAGTGRIPVGVSVRHIHITQADLETLYGTGHTLTKMRDLYQPGEFASKEVVTILGPRMRSIQNVRILGPLRDATQVELSRTDGILLGIDLPARNSGDLHDAAPIILVGPRGTVHLQRAAIRATRHIHMSPTEAVQLGVHNEELVQVKIGGDMGVIYDNVLIRIKEGLKLQMHVDTDDANAAAIKCDDTVTIVT